MSVSRWRSSSSVTPSRVMERGVLAGDHLSIGVAPGSPALRPSPFLSGSPRGRKLSGSRGLPDRNGVAARRPGLLREGLHAHFVLRRIVGERAPVARVARDLGVRLYEGGNALRRDPLAADL